jgi:hypothetical protein
MMQRRQLIQAMAAMAGASAITPALWAQAKVPVEVWKDPDCGCCKDWVAHLEANGFEVRVHDSGNVRPAPAWAFRKSWAPAIPRKSSACRESATHLKAMCRPARSTAC